MTVTVSPLPALCRTLGDDATVRAAVDAHYDPVWRFLRRMGVPEGHVEDAAQQVFLVLARRGAGVAPESVRSFLFGTALRVASDVRRKRERLAETAEVDALRHHRHPDPDAEDQLSQRQLRHHLDRLLDELAPELRAVFVLAELEEATMAEIARLLSIPAGTVASRLRRAREVFAERAEVLRAFVEKGEPR